MSSFPANTLSSTPNITLVGSVHFSDDTYSRVTETIAAEQPDVVAIELDERRIDELQERSHILVDTVKRILTQDRTIRSFLTTALFARAQYKLQRGSSFRPGHADMLPAADTAQKVGADVALIDTIDSEFLDSLSEDTQNDLSNLATQLLSGDFFELIQHYDTLTNSSASTQLTGVQSTTELIEGFEQVSYAELQEYLTAIENVLPTATDTILHERNRQMAGHLTWLDQNGYSTVAVMGKAHVPGVHEYLTHPETLPDEYLTQPPFHTGD